MALSSGLGMAAIFWRRERLECGIPMLDSFAIACLRYRSDFIPDARVRGEPDKLGFVFHERTDFWEINRRNSYDPIFAYLPKTSCNASAVTGRPPRRRVALPARKSDGKYKGRAPLARAKTELVLEMVGAGKTRHAVAAEQNI